MIRAIAFDLDDTLLDTSGILVPEATRHSFQILIDNGLKLTQQQCEQHRLEMIRSISHKDVFSSLASQYGSATTVLAVPDAIRAFYQPPLPRVLPLLPGARKNIDYLKVKYLLFVVTAGDELTQINKSKALGIDQNFEKIYVINSLKKERKQNAFLDIINTKKIKAEELLCIGNSLSSEIYDAMQIGAKSCFFEFGEDRGSISQVLGRQPDFHIRHHDELIPTCQL